MTDLITKQLTSYSLQFQVLKTTGWAESTWTDKRLAWDPAEHGGIDRLNVHHHHVGHNEIKFWKMSALQSLTGPVQGQNRVFLSLCSISTLGRTCFH